MGVLIMLTYLESEKVKLTYTQDELVGLGIGVANGSIGYDEILIWIKDHI